MKNLFFDLEQLEHVYNKMGIKKFNELIDLFYLDVTGIVVEFLNNTHDCIQNDPRHSLKDFSKDFLEAVASKVLLEAFTLEGNNNAKFVIGKLVAAAQSKREETWDDLHSEPIEIEESIDSIEEVLEREGWINTLDEALKLKRTELLREKLEDVPPASERIFEIFLAKNEKELRDLLKEIGDK